MSRLHLLLLHFSFQGWIRFQLGWRMFDWSLKTILNRTIRTKIILTLALLYIPNWAREREWGQKWQPDRSVQCSKSSDSNESARIIQSFLFDLWTINNCRGCVALFDKQWAYILHNRETKRRRQTIKIVGEKKMLFVRMCVSELVWPSWNDASCAMSNSLSCSSHHI